MDKPSFFPYCSHRRREKLSGNGVRRIFPWTAVFTEAESCDIMKQL